MRQKRDFINDVADRSRLLSEAVDQLEGFYKPQTCTQTVALDHEL